MQSPSHGVNFSPRMHCISRLWITLAFVTKQSDDCQTSHWFAGNDSSSMVFHVPTCIMRQLHNTCYTSLRQSMMFVPSIIIITLPVHRCIYQLHPNHRKSYVQVGYNFIAVSPMCRFKNHLHRRKPYVQAQIIFIAVSPMCRSKLSSSP